LSTGAGLKAIFWWGK